MTVIDLIVSDSDDGHEIDAKNEACIRSCMLHVPLASVGASDRAPPRVSKRQRAPLAFKSHTGQ